MIRAILSAIGLTTDRPSLRDCVIAGSCTASLGAMVPLAVIPGSVASLPDLQLFGVIAVVGALVLVYAADGYR
jgi:hypothetical protein